MIKLLDIFVMPLICIVIILLFRKKHKLLFAISLYSSFALIIIQIFFWDKLNSLEITNLLLPVLRSELKSMQEYLRDLVICNLMFFSVLFGNYPRLKEKQKFLFFMFSAFQIAILMTAVSFAFIDPDLKIFFNLMYLILPAYVLYELPKIVGLGKRNRIRIKKAIIHYLKTNIDKKEKNQ